MVSPLEDVSIGVSTGGTVCTGKVGGLECLICPVAGTASRAFKFLLSSVPPDHPCSALSCLVKGTSGVPKSTKSNHVIIKKDEEGV